MVKKETLSFSRIFLLFLCLVMLQFQSVFASSNVTDSISYLKIAELEYKDGQLFLLEQVKSVNHEDYEAHRLPLSSQETAQFLQLVEELKLLDMQSNDSSKQHEYRFEIEFVKNGKSGKISAYRNGMSEAEKASFDSYLNQMHKIIPRRNNVKALLAPFPDGQYQVKDWKRYTLHIGPKGWKAWEKRGDTIKPDDPVYVVDGKVIDPEKNVLRDIAPHDIESIEILKGTEAIEIYGEQAKHGAVLIETKKKKGFRLFRPRHSSKTP